MFSVGLRMIRGDSVMTSSTRTSEVTVLPNRRPMTGMSRSPGTPLLVIALLVRIRPPRMMVSPLLTETVVFRLRLRKVRCPVASSISPTSVTSCVSCTLTVPLDVIDGSIWSSTPVSR